MAWQIEFGTLAARTERLLMEQRAATFLHN